MNIPVFGNGDIDSPEKAFEYKEKYGVDGIMIGRASIGNPWVFNEIKHFMATGEHLPSPGMAERIEAVTMHFERSLDWKGDRLGIVEMRRHYANYFKGIPDFKKHRLDLVTFETPNEIRDKLKFIAESFSDHDFSNQESHHSGRAESTYSNYYG